MCNIFLNKNVKKFDRGEDVQLTEHFHLSELECKCGKCSHTLVHVGHIELLEGLRQFIKNPIYITSGYRCKKHNKSVGGVRNSQHVKGTATDIISPGISLGALAEYCLNFKGIGIYSTFIHLDSRSGKKARW